ncbi:MAG TPA: sigma-70 family RNA polymerase sigma factor [Stellaceae bacterium]
MALDDFGRLLETEIPRLRRYARALTRDAARADDLVQETLCRALRKAHLWEPGSNLRAWLFTLLHNQHVNDVRKVVREGLSTPVEEVAPLLSMPATQSMKLEMRDLDRAIGQLPDEQRQVVLLIGLEGLRYEQVAEILDVPVGTVRSRLSRARETLRRLMDLPESGRHRTESLRRRSGDDGTAAPAAAKGEPVFAA